MLNVWIKVDKKTSDHPAWNKIGSDDAYFYKIGEGRDERDGSGFKEGNMDLVEGNTYRFHIKDLAHPLYFTTDEGGGMGMPGKINLYGNVGVSDGYIDLTLDGSLKGKNIYYNCARHRYMGGKINVSPPTRVLAEGFAKLNAKTEREMAEISVDSIRSPLFGTRMPKGMDADGMYIVDQWGKVWRFNTKTQELGKKPFLEIWMDPELKLSDQYEERGILGFAFHPSYPNPKFIYVSCVRMMGSGWHDEFVQVLSIEEHDLGKKVTPIRILFATEMKNAYHWGGLLDFGPDGLLYFGVGDNTPNGQEFNQDRYEKGRLFWIDVSDRDTKLNTSSPLFPIGLRNPRNPSWNVDGTIGFLPDVGYESFEEINLIKPGACYGWPHYEGHMQRIKGHAMTVEYPIHDYGREVGIAILGGFFYDGRSNPDLIGCYLFADYSGRVYSLRPVVGYDQKSSRGWIRELLHVFGADVTLQGVGLDGNGEFYVMGKKAGSGGVMYYLGGSIHSRRTIATTRLGDTMTRLLPKLSIKDEDGDDVEFIRPGREKITEALSKMNESIKTLETKLDRLESAPNKGGTYVAPPSQPPFDMNALINALNRERQVTIKQSPQRRVAKEEPAEDTRADERPKKKLEISVGEGDKGKFVEEIIALTQEGGEGIKSIVKRPTSYTDQDQMENVLTREYNRDKKERDAWERSDRSESEPPIPASLPKTRAEWNQKWKDYVTPLIPAAQEMLNGIPVALEQFPEKFAAAVARRVKSYHQKMREFETSGETDAKKRPILTLPSFDQFWKESYVNVQAGKNAAFKDEYSKWIKKRENSALFTKAEKQANRLAQDEINKPPPPVEIKIKKEPGTEQLPSLSQSSDTIPEGGPPPPPPPP